MPAITYSPTSTLVWPRIDSPVLPFSPGDLQTDALKTMLRYQIEALRFWKSRCEQDLRLLENIWSPDHVSDTFDLWCSFWQRALLDYSTEAGRLADIGSSLASITAKRVHDEGKRLAQDLAARTVM